MNARASTVAKPGAEERALVITRTFDAPRALVWAAWTESERLRHWSAPRGFVVTHGEGDIRPGGGWRACMRAPDGTEHWNSGVYREVVAPERLVFTFAWEQNGQRGHETLVTVTFAEQGGRTKMVFRQEPFETTESRDGHGDGWSQAFERLANYLAPPKAA